MGGGGGVVIEGGKAADVVEGGRMGRMRDGKSGWWWKGNKRESNWPHRDESTKSRGITTYTRNYGLGAECTSWRQLSTIFFFKLPIFPDGADIRVFDISSASKFQAVMTALKYPREEELSSDVFS